MARRTVKVGNISFVEGSRTQTFKMPIADALTEIRLAVSGVLNVTVPATLRQLGHLNCFKQITISRGGRKIKSIGLNSQVASAGKSLYLLSQSLQGFLPENNAPAVGVAANAFNFVLPIHFAIPRLLLKNAAPGAGNLTAIMPSEKSLDIDIDCGAVADVISAGTATLTTMVIEVIAVVDSSLNGLRAAKLPLMIFAEHAKQMAIASGAGANTQFSDDIDAIGGLLHVGVIGFDNSLLTNAAYNTLMLKANGTDERVSGSWPSLQAAAKAEAGLQAAAGYPEGVNWLPLDAGFDGRGLLDMTDTAITKSLKMIVDYDALTAVNVLLAHSYNLIPQD